VFVEVEAVRDMVGDPRKLRNRRVSFLRNPNCSSGSRCFWLTCVDRRLAIIRSNSLPAVLRRLIGL
jgi:hypothetical protein